MHGDSSKDGKLNRIRRACNIMRTMLYMNMLLNIMLGSQCALRKRCPPAATGPTPTPDHRSVPSLR